MDNTIFFEFYVDLLSLHTRYHFHSIFMRTRDNPFRSFTLHPLYPQSPRASRIDHAFAFYLQHGLLSKINHDLND